MAERRRLPAALSLFQGRAATMHIQFASCFCDPVSGEPMRLAIREREGDEVLAGELTCASATYPIVRGVPRFVPPENYSGSFGYQWNRWPRLQFDSENAGRPMEGYTGRMFERITGVHALDGQTVLDIGCGPGRFIEIARKKGARVIGVDYSLAVEAARENFRHDPDVCICQADALSLPFPPASFDGAYSIGVLHHTPDPCRGVEQAARVLEPGGWFAISVYGKGGYYDFPSVQAWRKVFKTLWPVAGQFPPLAYAYATAYGTRPLTRIPLLGKALRAVLPCIHLPDVRWSVLDTFDSVTPSYQSAHRPFEVFQWLKSAGLEHIEPSDWGIGAFHGQKPATGAVAA
jgi:SAM-dependent methyltransferase